MQIKWFVPLGCCGSYQYYRESWFIYDLYAINNDSGFSSANDKINMEKLELNTQQQRSYKEF